MSQLNIFDYLATVKQKAVEAKKVVVQKIKQAIKGPDIVISIDKNGDFDSASEFGLVKLALFRGANILHCFSLDKISAIDYVRGDDDSLNLLDNTTITHAFDAQASRKLAALKKEFTRRNIALRMDVREEDIENAGIV